MAIRVVIVWHYRQVNYVLTQEKEILLLLARTTTTPRINHDREPKHNDAGTFAESPSAINHTLFLTNDWRITKHTLSWTQDF